ncbi:unnamed protein product, partial [Pylaiella littoralis]
RAVAGTALLDVFHVNVGAAAVFEGKHARSFDAVANGQHRHCCATVAAAVAVEAAAVGQQLPRETTVAAHGYRQGPCKYSTAGLRPARLLGDPKCDSSRPK